MNFSFSNQPFKYILFAFLSFTGFYINAQTFTSSGSFMVPCGVTTITVECWGGGGAGGAATGNPSGGGGGAGGAYSYSVINVTSGSTINYTVGAGGTGGTGAGPSGGNTTFSGVIAVGGAGGALASTNSTSGAGGVASSAGSAGSTIFAGGSGGTGASGTSAGGGGEAAYFSGVGVSGGNNSTGTSANAGGDGGAPGLNSGNGTIGSNGSVPGGGGGGGRAGNNTDRNGGNGGGGQITILYSAPPTANAGPDQAPAACTTTATLAGNTIAGYTGLWTCVTNCTGVTITSPTSANSTVSGLSNGTATAFQWVLTQTATSCTLASDNVTITPAAGTCPPPNDDPSGATPIVTSASCSYTTFTNASATSSTCGTIPAPGCASYSGQDVWFSVTVPASGAISFDSQTGTMTDGGMAIYSGTPCGVLTLLGCDDDNSTNGAMPSLSVSGQTPGATLYIRFWDYGGGTGTFGLCATAVTPPSNDNCSGATAFPAVPTNGTCSNLNNQSTANATPSNVTPTGACTSNFGTPTADVWFSFAATGTAMNLAATWVSGNTDVYWQVFSGACTSTMTALLCTDTDAGGTISGLTIGQTYYIKLYPYSGGTTVQNMCLTVIPDPCTTTTNVATCGTSISTTFGAGTGVWNISMWFYNWGL